MRITRLAAVAAVTSTVLAGPVAFAADTELSGPVSGPYVGAGWGQFNLKPQNFNDVESGISDITHSHADAFKISAGYRFMPYFALEADYIDFGNPGSSFSGTGSSGNYKLHVSGFAPFAVATLPLGPFEVFGKAGWLFSDNNLKVYLNQPGQQFIQSSHSTSDFIYGGGVGITFLRHLNVNVEYDRVRVENANDSDALWLAAQWRF
jgi:Outer membrane protein beta-barrel domain